METWPKINFNFQAEISKLKDQLNESCRREKELDDHIKSTLSENADLPKQLDLIFSRVKSRLAVAESDSKQLDALLNLTSSLADNVSGQVRELDLCKSRVVECLQRVEDALDLRFCTEGVRSAMANEDYEQAASHVHRFLSLDNSVVGLRNLSLLSDDEKDQEHPVESLEHQLAVMKKATDDLKQILAAKFDEALQGRDVASMERFFKLFPFLGQHDLGLKKFGAYLKSQIADAVS
uniref:Conserved oligomeric Golgi complex subunit 4 n=1 Tax=Romanomermis culicivorax TaxID=13658 RepID=A0A915JWU2_ROMCU